jgi:hypothetical protein
VIVVIFGGPGNFSIEALYDHGMSGDIEVASNVLDLPVAGARYLFGMPSIDDQNGSGWQDAVARGGEMNFTIAAVPTDLWSAGENWTTFYNWTVTVINPEGMVVGGDLSKYNTGALNIDRGDLDNTSVVSAWDNGYNSVFYTLWDRDGGTRLNGSAAMTPTGKEITYGSAAWNAWTTGAWRPTGGGHLTFNQGGQYLFVLTLAKNGETVSPALLQEIMVR